MWPPVKQWITLNIGLTATTKAVALLSNEAYCDQSNADVHFRVGGTTDVRLGFAGCALPVVLNYNTPNNSLFILWGPEASKFPGLFPRVSRHKET